MKPPKGYKWKKYPSVMTGGKPYFYSARSDTGRVWFMFNRLNKQWELTHETP